MRVQKTRKRQRQREHVKQNLREDRNRNFEFYRSNQEHKEEKDNKEHKEHREEHHRPLKQKNESMLLFDSASKSTHKRKVSSISPEVVDVLNDPKKLEEFKKFQEYLKMTNEPKEIKKVIEYDYEEEEEELEEEDEEGVYYR
jgi:hypothetical protein